MRGLRVGRVYKSLAGARHFPPDDALAAAGVSTAKGPFSREGSPKSEVRT